MISPRAWSGRPLTLAIGWITSCALVTGVTLTAVDRVNHEINGSGPTVVSEDAVTRQVAAQSQSASAASASAASASASQTTHSSPSVAPADGSATRPARTTAPPTRRTAAPNTANPAVVPPPTTDAPTAPSSPTADAAPDSGSPTAPASPSSDATASTSPSPSTSTSKTVIYVKDASNQTIGQIIIACSDDAIANASAGLAPSSTYTLTEKSMTDPAVDVLFSKSGTSNEYIYRCRGGQAIGGPPEHH